jgi:hypothetical protein
MPPKKDPVLLALGECPEKWNQFLLKTYGLPKEPQSKNVVSETEFRDPEGQQIPLADLAGRQIRLGEGRPKGLLKLCAEDSSLEKEPTEEWKRALGFMRAMAWIYAFKNKLPKQARAELIKLVDELNPNEPLGTFDESLGTPEEFLDRWAGHELDVRFVSKNRSTLMFEIWYQLMRPDEPDDVEDDGSAPIVTVGKRLKTSESPSSE